MKKTQNATAKYNLSKEQEMELITAIRQGDKNAENTLLKALYGFMKRTHEYGPDGISGKAKPSLASDFETALADYDIYETFQRCVQTYNPNRGSFRNHLAYRMNMAAKDRIRNRTKSQKMDNPDNVISLEAPCSDYESDDSSTSIIYNEGVLERMRELEMEAEEHDARFDLIDHVGDHFGENSIESRYIELYCTLGVDAKKHTGEICDTLHCSRQTLTNIKKRIRTYIVASRLNAA